MITSMHQVHNDDAPREVIEHFLVKDGSKEVFIKGEGYVRVKKATIRNIEMFGYKGKANSLIEISKWVKQNFDYFKAYVDMYGLNIVREQLECSNNDDVGQSKCFMFIAHSCAHGKHFVEYIVSTIELIEEILTLAEVNTHENKSTFGKIWIQDAIKNGAEKYLSYTWYLENWSINFLSSNGWSDFEHLCYAAHDERTDISMLDGLELLQKGLGARVEQKLIYERETL